MRVVIFEPGITGHRLHYVRHMVAALAELPVQATVCLAAEAPGSPEFATQLASLPLSVNWDASLTRPPLAFAQRATHAVKELKRCIAVHRPQRLYLPSGDGISQVLGLRRTMGAPDFLRKVIGESLILRGGFAYPQESFTGRIKAKLSWAAVRRAPWDVLHLLDPLVFDRVTRDDPRLARRCQLMPDPVELPTRDDRFAARRELGLPEEGRYIACVGLINNRKGCDRLIEAFVAASNLRPTDRLLLAGAIDPETVPTLRLPAVVALVDAGRIVTIDRTLSSLEMMTAIEAADVIAAFYPRHIGSASLVIRAAAQRRVVLTSDYGWPGVIVPRFGLGITVDADDRAALPTAIARVLAAAEGFVPTAAAERFIAFHRAENFAAHWTDALRATLNVARSAAWTPWSHA